MKCLTIEDILIPGAELKVEVIDFDRRADLKLLFEETAKAQEELQRIKDLPFENLLITI